jgi:SAM-dependent methyltransferase
MTERQAHWDAVFASKADAEMGWYEPDATQTLRFVHQVPDWERATILLPGAGTSVLVEALLERPGALVLNDVSAAALAKLGDRVAGRDADIIFLHHDIAEPLPEDTPRCDLWIDRAVLHFLVEEPDIRGYFGNVRRSVRVGGHVLLAEFAPEGAEVCSGLPVHRCSAGEMAERLGPEFRLLRQESYTHVGPRGDLRPYVYALFERTDENGAPSASTQPRS